MRLDDFDYELPEELIAQHPPDDRGGSRMILVDRARTEVRETRFANFPRYVHEGDILVVNDTKVIPARLLGRKESGGQVEVFLTRRLAPRRWLALMRPSRRMHPGDRVIVGAADHAIVVEEERGGGEWTVALPEGVAEMRFIERFGRVPLPPYIKRDAAESDRHRYQTVYARVDGSVAAPTAGLHFTDELLQSLARRGVTVMPLTLHIGPGTFRPLERETVEENVLDPEYVSVRTASLDEVRRARADGRRVVAVGTTVTRALEAALAGAVTGGGTVEIDGEQHLTGWTDLFIRPGWRFRAVDALVTNLHLPRSSLLVLVAAFAGRERILDVYKWAAGRRFRFYSYGDVMFIR
jgi:S-adenosylmethionine:tRNA ribosyltransferase-isomerase